MSKLNDEQRSLLRLILRSDRRKDGWYRVSRMLWPTVSEKLNLPSDLAEMKPFEDGGLIRLTERGQAVADYT